MAEKDRLLQDLDRCKEQLDMSKDDVILHVPEEVLEHRAAQNFEIEVRNRGILGFWRRVEKVLENRAAQNFEI